jgi:hypothetical protein
LQKSLETKDLLFEGKLADSTPRLDAQAALMQRDNNHVEELAKLITRAELAKKVTSKLNEMAQRLGVMVGDVVSLKISDRVRDQELKVLRSNFDKSVKVKVDEVKKAAAGEDLLMKRIAALEQEKMDKEANLASCKDELKRREDILADLLLQLEAEIARKCSPVILSFCPTGYSFIASSSAYFPGVFADSFPEYQKEAEDAVHKIRTVAQQPMVQWEAWTMEELCTSIHAQLKPASDLINKLSFAMPALHLALWPEDIQGAHDDMD